MLAGSYSCLPAQIGISKAHSDRRSGRQSDRPPKNVLWCTCFRVDGAGPGRAKIVPAAARGWSFRTGSGGGKGSFLSRVSSVAVWFTLDRVDRLEILVVRFSGALREARGPVWFVGFSCGCVV